MSHENTETDLTTTAPETNAAVVRNLAAAFNTKDREEFDACYADSVEVHTTSGTRTMTHDEHWDEVLGMFEAIPDLQATLHSVAADGDRVFYRATYAGTHTNEIDGAEPTGDRLAWEHWSEYRFDDGVIAEAWQLSDTYTLYTQLDLIEATDS